jgi:methionine-rich copper-binding protein CopC
VPATAAFAHAQLRKAAVPAIRSTAVSPTEIRLKFSEDLEPGFAEIALATQGSVAEPFRPASVDPVDNSVLIVRIRQALDPGIYKVTWHAVSADTHQTEGSFAFIVAP